MDKIAGTVVGYIEKTGTALGLYGNLVKSAMAEKKAAADLIPGLINKFKEAKLLPAGQDKLAAAELGNHANALEILDNVITVMTERVKMASSDRAALHQGDLMPDPSGTKAAADDPDQALLALVPGLAEKYRNQ
jgi:hypothetical protein